MYASRHKKRKEKSVTSSTGWKTKKKEQSHISDKSSKNEIHKLKQTFTTKKETKKICRIEEKKKIYLNPKLD